MYSNELERILNKKWAVEISRQPTLNSWDVKMAISLFHLHTNKWMQVCGFHQNLDEALLKCEQMILSRWDELHPEADKTLYGVKEKV